MASLGTTIAFALVREWNAAIVSSVVVDVSLPLMCIFKGVGKGRLNWIADEYNINRTINTAVLKSSVKNLLIT